MKRVLIVGGGPAGLMSATQLSECNCEITLIDQKAAIGRKFLVAGDGGFNLTHSEKLQRLLEKYDSNWIRDAVKAFDNQEFIAFLNRIGIETRIGSSGKVFPVEEIKPVQVLNAWKHFLEPKVKFVVNSRFIDFTEQHIVYEKAGKQTVLNFDYLVLALGGKSWPITGSDGRWTDLFEQKGIQVKPFQASNSGLELYENWLGDLEGKILKNVVLSCGDQHCAGDVVCTNYGLEGKPVYAINRALRELEKKVFQIDFKPQMTEQRVFEILKKARNPSWGLKDLKLGDTAVFWLKNFVSKAHFTDLKRLAKSIKAFSIGIKGFRPLEEVISSAGGVALSEISESGELKKFPNVFCAGEMLDWDAPTGGYLIQGCVSSGFVAGREIGLRIEKEKNDIRAIT
ncbi:NAD(P)-dependent oxidoreductase [Fluviicola sp.]|jgi:uncharacterized flavoprotein (TIGR03862 family)|uniref:NAD(P)/FAD-dependent oxidoreductase n=1 Tax=Fluviicola sp. TaxID=1917219 RepID=UPI0028293D78|nr:NAD(P)-dependent oxidoreductase [Fluviicola sp.]MDR0803395.1 NAD(P)-dependent oxidoreductase [Fluviicola sp.]